MEKRAIIDENCFVIPPLTGPREDAAFSGKPFVSGIRPPPALGEPYVQGESHNNDETEQDVQE